MKNFQRDYFIDALYKKAKKNKNIILLSADFGAPALDKFRKNLKSQFIHTGISEQNMINVAAGLALKKKKVFVYAMAPFVTLRCLEQHKCCSSIMNLPINTIVAGIGLGYADAGPTHYATEDQASLRSLIKSKVYTVSDSISAEKLAEYLLEKSEFSFARLERLPVIDLYQKNKIKKSDIQNGFKYLIKSKNSKNLVISQGYQTNRLFSEIKNKKIKNSINLVDIFRSKPFPRKIIDDIKKAKNLIIIDEQILSSSLTSIIGEVLIQENINIKVKSFHLNESHVFDNGGREKLLNSNGLNLKIICKYLSSTT